jgi:hypothetical protein
MKKLLLLTCTMFLIASTGFSQAMDIQETITNKEKGIYEALKTGDTEAIKTQLSDEMMTVYDTGFRNRQQELEDMSKMKMSSYELSDIRVMQPADNVAIIAYALHAEGNYMDEEFSGDYYATSTWVNRDGKWWAIMHTETTAAPEEEMQMNEQ